jgi:hypothetical protein
MADEVQWGRIYSLEFGPREGSGLIIDNLRISFAVEKSLEKFPNNSTFKIYNLSESTRAFIENEKSVIVLKAGYGNSKKGIFTGDISMVWHEKNGPDIITNVEAGDGLSSFINSRIDISMAPGSTVRNVIDVLKNSMGVVAGELQGLNQDREYLNGHTMSGPTRNELDNLAEADGLEWSIQDNKLQMLPRSSGSSLPAFLLTAETGLIGTPYKTKIINESILSKKDGKERDNGMHCVSLLNGEITPGRIIRVKTKLLTGNFKVIRVRHFGDFEGNEWFSEIEGRELKK